MRELWELYVTFFRIGLFTFGGGLAMLPMFQKELVEKRGWATAEELLDYYAVGQATPGIIAVNTATFIGYKRRGVIGGIVATLGMVTPSLVIIMSLATVIARYQDAPLVQHAFRGIRIAVVALIFTTVAKLARQAVKNRAGLALFVLAMVLIVFADVSPVLVLLAAGALGVVRAAAGMRRPAKGGNRP